MTDNDWKYEMTALLAEVRANQVNMSKKLDEYIADSRQRLDTLDDTVFGDKTTTGLSEEVRGLKGKWAAMYGIVIIILSAFLNIVVESAFIKSQGTASAASVSAPAPREVDIPILEDVR